MCTDGCTTDRLCGEKRSVASCAVHACQTRGSCLISVSCHCTERLPSVMRRLTCRRYGQIAQAADRGEIDYNIHTGE